MATYTYQCLNEECELEGFKKNRPMSEYKEPADCPDCGTSCERAQGDWCKNFRLIGPNWYAGGYHGASNGVASYKQERIKAGKDPHKHPQEK